MCDRACYHVCMNEPEPSFPENKSEEAEFTHALRERLAFIDFQLYFLGELRRNDLIARFGISSAVATRAIAQYLAVAPDNAKLDKQKVYRPTPQFAPWYHHSVSQALATLAQGLTLSIGSQPQAITPCELPLELALPKVEILAAVARAIKQGKPIKVRYVSMTSGENEREIVPFALVTNRVRWHVRAYDRKNRTFLDFVLRRIVEATVLEDASVEPHELPSSDAQWSRVITLELVPHPGIARAEVVNLDYDMPDGVLRVKVRAANVGYVTKLWGIDCSPDHSLSPDVYHLWLKDPLSIYGASTALAPGYVPP
ncbi:YafY family protein [Acidovorax sacchari]